MKDDLISRQAAIEYFMTNTNWYDEDGYEIHDAEDKRALLKSYFDGIPSVQSEITDAQAIDHLRSTWWMQNHDHEMYVMGMRDGLANDSNSYDSLIQPEQKVGTWIIDGHHLRCSACGVYMCSEDREGDRIALHFCPNCGKKMVEQDGDKDTNQTVQ